MSRPEIVPYSQHWPAAFSAVARRIRDALGPAALRIDHIGSTAVPRLPAKNVIDIQVSVGDLGAADALAAAGFRPFGDIRGDHRPPGDRSPDAHMPDTATYAEVKDPAVDLIALAAEEWAAASGWQPGPSDG